jgi:hypothetical protein
MTTLMLQSKKPLHVKLSETKSWVINVSGLFLGSDEKKLEDILNDGIVLCTLFHKLYPEVFPFKKINTKFAGVSSQWKKRENIELFLKIAREKLDMDEASLFQVTDVYEWNNPKKVVDSLFNFYTKCKKIGLINQELKVWPGQPIPKLSMKETKRDGVRYAVLYDSVPSSKDELPILKGDVVIVYDIYKDGWCRALLNKDEGVVPLNYLQIIEDDETATAPGTKTTQESKIAVKIKEKAAGLNLAILSSPPTTKDNKKPTRDLDLETATKHISIANDMGNDSEIANEITEMEKDKFIAEQRVTTATTDKSSTNNTDTNLNLETATKHISIANDMGNDSEIANEITEMEKDKFIAEQRVKAANIDKSSAKTPAKIVEINNSASKQSSETATAKQVIAAKFKREGTSTFVTESSEEIAATSTNITTKNLGEKLLTTTPTVIEQLSTTTPPLEKPTTAAVASKQKGKLSKGDKNLSTSKQSHKSKKNSGKKMLRMKEHLPITNSLETAVQYYGAYNAETKKWIDARYKLHEADVLIKSKEKSRNFLNEDEKKQLRKAEKVPRRYMAALANYISKDRTSWPNSKNLSTVITGAGIPCPVAHCHCCGKLITVSTLYDHSLNCYK